MARHLLMFLALLMVGQANAGPLSDATTTYTTSWAMGKFEYPWDVQGFQHYVSVWTDSVAGGGKLGRLGGEVTKKTRIRFMNRPDFKKEQLNLVTGHTVFIWAMIRTEQTSSGRKQYLDSMDLYVLD